MDKFVASEASESCAFQELTQPCWIRDGAPGPPEARTWHGTAHRAARNAAKPQLRWRVHLLTRAVRRLSISAFGFAFRKHLTDERGNSFRELSNAALLAGLGQVPRTFESVNVRLEAK